MKTKLNHIWEIFKKYISKSIFSIRLLTINLYYKLYIIYKTFIYNLIVKIYFKF